MTERKFAIEIQATNKTWFADYELPVTTDPAKADERISELRKQGFKTRARMIENGSMGSCPQSQRPQK